MYNTSMEQMLMNLLLALAANELIHNIAEVAGMRNKVKRLTAYMDKLPFKELPVNIDTRLKSYAVSTVLFVVFVGLLYTVFSVIALDTTVALWTAIGLLVLSYFTTAVLVDAYHVDIEQVTRRFKKK